MVWLVHKETIYHDEIASSINIWEDGEYWAAQDFTELVDPASGIEQQEDLDLSEEQKDAIDDSEE